MDYDKKSTLDWINQHWPGSETCTICNDTQWVLFDDVWELRGFNNGSLVVGGPVIPVITLMCNVCGHMIFFNAIAVKAIQKTDNPLGDYNE